MRKWKNEGGWELVLIVHEGRWARITLLDEGHIRYTQHYEWFQLDRARMDAAALVALGHMEVADAVVA